MQAWRIAQATCVFGLVAFTFSNPGLAQDKVAGVCGYLPLPPELAGKQVVLAIPANKTEANPCGPGSVVAYTLVDGLQVFLPVVTASTSTAPTTAVPARRVVSPPQTLATDLSSLATAPDRDDPFTLEMVKAWDIGPAELLAEDRRETALRAARVSERRAEISSAATAGDAVAQWLTGLDLINQGTTSQDFQKAASILEKSADQGFAPAQYHLAALHYQAQGVRFDKAKLIGLLAAASAAGDVHAQRMAALLIQSGTYVSQDTDAAAAIEARLADRGFVPAVVNRLVRGMSAATATVDISELKRLSDLGSSSAGAMLSRAYLYGYHVAKDKALAVSYAELAASRGFIGALDTAADHFRTGKGADKDKDLAAQLDAKYFPLILASAQKGHALDQVRVADAYAAGHGVRRDTATWRTWIEKAQATRLPDARETVARAQKDGLAGYARDCPTAMRELGELSRDGYYPADLVIGWDYVMGACYDKDLYMARQYFERVDRVGNTAERASAQGYLNYIKGQGLSPKQEGGGFLDVIAEAAPVMIGALNDATADIAAQRQEAANQQARADQQYQSAMAAAQARQRQAGAESAAAAAERDARNAPSEQARQNALARQQAALAQARVAAQSATPAPAQVQTRTATISAATPRPSGGASFASATGTLPSDKRYYPEAVVVCSDHEGTDGGIIANCALSGPFDGGGVVQNDRIYLDRYAGRCEGRLLQTATMGEIGYRVYGCGYPWKNRANMDRQSALTTGEGYGPIPGRRVFECPAETTCE